MAMELPPSSDIAQSPQAPQQPPASQFPALGFNITPTGVVFSIVLGQYVSINQAVDEAAMNQICRQWLESRKMLKQRQETELAVIRNIKRTKH